MRLIYISSFSASILSSFSRLTSDPPSMVVSVVKTSRCPSGVQRKMNSTITTRNTHIFSFYFHSIKEMRLSNYSHTTIMNKLRKSCEISSMECSEKSKFSPKGHLRKGRFVQLYIHHFLLSLFHTFSLSVFSLFLFISLFLFLCLGVFSLF